ncbi:hypothetical protein M404DRAFT_529012 [Pisolithus tinctorius Marx 270]|uniref:Uncharacterized protein n=1 Tax=Pisolithus tinctorius Marx 270 TaxID=870435 RepID=A0A0C3MWE3_PISTI|nr:hypothetical protein M404DRAFT_529012 [Pisolithus tinctorius Marx 270]
MCCDRRYVEAGPLQVFLTLVYVRLAATRRCRLSGRAVVTKGRAEGAGGLKRDWVYPLLVLSQRLMVYSNGWCEVHKPSQVGPFESHKRCLTHDGN